MEPKMVSIDTSVKDQTFTLAMNPNGNSVLLKVRLIYREYVKKWFATISDTTTGENLLTNFPLVSSEKENLNDLLKQIAYKRIGSIICFPVIDQTSTQDPEEHNLGEFEVLWGDSFWISN